MNHFSVAAISLLMLGSTPSTPARGGSPGTDSVAAAWKARAELASKRLEGTGLDACDRAVEMAFKSPDVGNNNGKRMFVLRLEIGGKAMMVGWGYDDQKLADFSIATLPPRWITRQVAGQKTLTVLPAESNCAFDLCPNEPLANGRCSGE